LSPHVHRPVLDDGDISLIQLSDSTVISMTRCDENSLFITSKSINPTRVRASSKIENPTADLLIFNEGRRQTAYPMMRTDADSSMTMSCSNLHQFAPGQALRFPPAIVWLQLEGRRYVPRAAGRFHMAKETHGREYHCAIKTTAIIIACRGKRKPTSALSTGIIMNTVIVAFAMSLRHNVMPDTIERCLPSGTQSTSELVRGTRGAGAGRPATGRPSRTSHSTQSATAWSLH
jgi:hypothetical protein